MKNLKDILEKASTERLTTIADVLGLKRRSGKTVYTTLMSISGIYTICESLTEHELQVLELLYNDNDGMTFGEVEKKLHIKIQELEEITKKLSSLYLLSTMKNRQLLNNKMDKIYGIKEISHWFSFVNPESLRHHLADLGKGLMEKSDAGSIKIDDNGKKIIQHILIAGGVVPFDELTTVIPQNVFLKTMDDLLEKGLVFFKHLNSPGYTRIALLCHECTAEYTLSLLTKSNIKKNLSVDNKYLFFNNILNAFDTITTYGLFLTKQMEFRKIDKRRIIDAMIPLKESTGGDIDPEVVADMTLAALNRMNCLKQQKDIATITFNQVEKELNDPQRFLGTVLKSLQHSSKDQQFFPPSLEIPSLADIVHGLTIIDSSSDRMFSETRILLLNWMVDSGLKHKYSTLENLLKDAQKRTEDLLTFFLMTGLVVIEKGAIFLSYTGSVYMKKPVPENQEPKEAVYINPDLSLMIPVHELPAEAHYFLLAFTEITKDDVMLHVEVQKNSVVRAHKRGMKVEHFLHTLTLYAKNDIPQNLQFLLNNWSEQTIIVTINGVILLKTNHPSFIDDILMNKAKSAVVERISEDYAIILKDEIDTIIKLARKEDAVVSLFEEHTVTD